MKRGLILAAILLLAGLAYLRAETKDKAKNESYQPGTVVTVDKHVSESNYLGTPTDAPLQADDYSYDVGIRVNCTVYVGRYESAIDYLPSSFAPNHSVEVLLQRYILYVRMPGLEREVKMGIVARKHVKNDACRAHG
jgi:hypothetical protein